MAKFLLTQPMPSVESNGLFINSDEILSNIKIYDLLGKEVISKAININSASIDLTNLKDAIYIVNVKSRNSRTSTFKIVKN